MSTSAPLHGQGARRRRVRTCKTCVRRRVLCDATSPACRKCVDRGLECPGVLEPLSFTFKDETQSIAGNKGRPPGKSPPKPSKASRTPSSSSVESQQDALALTTPISVLMKDSLSLKTADFARRLFLQGHHEILKASGIADPFFQCLKPALGAGHVDAHVSLSADAVALAALGHSSDRSDIMKAAAQKYGQAITATQKVLFKPKQASTDATLSAVKLLMAYEFLTADAFGSSSWIQHVFGQLAITLQRGAESFKTPEQVQLLYTTFFHNALCALYSSTPLGGPDGGWLSAKVPDSPEKQVLENTVETISVRVESSRVHKLPDADPQKKPAMLQALERAEITLRNLVSWSKALPAHWSRSVIDATFDIDTENIEQVEVWPGMIATYKDINVAHYWNLNRTAQLYAAGVAVRALWWLGAFSGAQQEEQLTTARRAEQMIAHLNAVINDICADVPYYLGIRNLPPQLQHIGPPSRLDLDGRGGVSLWCWLFNSMSVESVDELQRRWMRGRMLYIGNHVKYKWATFLADNTSPTLIFDAQESHVRNMVVNFLDSLRNGRSSETLLLRSDG